MIYDIGRTFNDNMNNTWRVDNVAHYGIECHHVPRIDQKSMGHALFSWEGKLTSISKEFNILIISGCRCESKDYDLGI